MYKPSSVTPLVCGAILTLALASAAGGGDKAAGYLAKDGRLKERLVVSRSDALGKTASIAIEPGGSWAEIRVVIEKDDFTKQGKLTEQELSELAKALAQHDLANLPMRTGKKDPAASGKAPTLIITFGKKSVTFVGARADSKEDEQVLNRFTGIASVIEKLTVQPNKKK